jgi:hypothetical protein
MSAYKQFSTRHHSGIHLEGLSNRLRCQVLRDRLPPLREEGDEVARQLARGDADSGCACLDLKDGSIKTDVLQHRLV